ncbi:hypothetical protein [Sinorhizobium meliloti]|uniref:hypothetical protein n=1 Tax=Rhizobium meliloti TaxID=382 RepID=UPI0006ACD420|nr:hypothetical protein [Sinorhizobium meliloti]WQO67736.1 hypothetical protein U8C40_18245 [Sinorhizobium medicae]
MTRDTESASDSALSAGAMAARFLSQSVKSLGLALTAGFLIQRRNELVNELVDNAFYVRRHVFARES